MSLRTGSLSLVFAAVAALGCRGQEPAPPPTPPPVTPPAEPAPTETPQEPEGQEPADRQRAGRRRGQGPGGQRQNQDLPEFTPVAAPSIEALAGKQYFWLTMYPDFVAKYDPATDAVVQKVKLNHGMFWDTTLTHDRKRLLVVTDQQRLVEVVDLQTGTVIGEHPFAEEGLILRVRDVRELAGGVHWFVRVERIKKQIDRYSFEPSQWLLYDTTNKKVVRRVQRLPDAMDRGIRLAAEGTHWQSQDDDGNLLFLDARKLTEIGRIDLRTPRFFGAGALRLSGTDLLDGRDPTRARMLFTSPDPVERTRTSWGVLELDLKQRRVVDVQEWGPQVGGWGMRIAHKKLVGATMMGSFGGGRESRDNRSRLMLIDLRNGKKLVEAYEEFRPRRSLVAISPEADKVYIGTAGSDFEVFDSQLKRLKTVELEGEIAGQIYVVDG